MAPDTPIDPNPGQVVTPGVDITGIYRRHDGPYSLMMTRMVKADLVMGATRGPMIARQAHTEAVALVTGPGDVVQVYVFSEKEQQFIGAIYERGKMYAPWNQEIGPHGYGCAGVESDAGDEPVAGPTLLPRRQCPVRPEGGSDGAPEGEPVSGDPGVRAVRDGARKEKPARTPRDRFPSVRGRAVEVDPGNAERWPTSAGAGLIRTWLDEHRQGTVAEIIQAIGAQVQATGVQFPASMISRLKQAGFLREAPDGTTQTD